MSTNKLRILAKLSLFTAAIIWGSSFFIMKNAIGSLSPHYVLVTRFLLGAAILAIIFNKRMRNINKNDITSGAIIGLFLFIAYSTQTLGLASTSPGKNAFLTSIYCVIVPFLFWTINKTRPDKYNIISAFLCVLGIGLVSLTNTLTISVGDSLTIVCGFFYAAHIVAISIAGRGKDPIVITIIQFFFCGLLAGAVAIIFEPFPTAIQPNAIIELLYLTVFATCICLLLQNIGQKYCDPSSAAIILTLESVFGLLFSMLFYGEHVTVKLFFGFSIIFVAVIISETKLSFITKYFTVNSLEKSQRE